VPYLKSIFGHKDIGFGLRITLQGLLSLPSSTTEISECFIEFRDFQVESMPSPIVMTYEIQENEKLIFQSNRDSNKYSEEELLDLFRTSLSGLLKGAYVPIGVEKTMTNCHALAQNFDDRARSTIWSIVEGIEGVENVEEDGTRNVFAIAYRSPKFQTLSPLQSTVLPWIEIRSLHSNDVCGPVVEPLTIHHVSPDEASSKNTSQNVPPSPSTVSSYEYSVHSSPNSSPEPLPDDKPGVTRERALEL
jgi:hypothetical protein